MRCPLTIGLVLLPALWFIALATGPAVHADEPQDSWVGTYHLLTGDGPPSIAFPPGQYRLSKQEDGYRLERIGDPFFAARTLHESKPGVLKQKGGGLELVQGAMEFPGERRVALRLFCGYLLKEPDAKRKK
jgi:hypothetical protein